LLKILRESLADVPIIVLTNLDRDLDELACICEGADTFLRKPVVTVLLAEYVRSHLNRSKPRSRVEFNESSQPSSSQLHHQASEEED
jgi:DNA-binding response OmpR family regulator